MGSAECPGRASDKKLWRCPKGWLNWCSHEKRFLGVLLSVIALSGMPGADTQTPQVGQPAPDFSLPSAEGGLVSLKDYKGKWVVLYFCRKDFTSGCTLEAHCRARPGEVSEPKRHHSRRERRHSRNRTRIFVRRRD